MFDGSGQERKGWERGGREVKRMRGGVSRGMRGVGLLAHTPVLSSFFLVRYPCRDVIPVWHYPSQFTDPNTTSTVALCPGDLKLRTKNEFPHLGHLHQANDPKACAPILHP